MGKNKISDFDAFLICKDLPINELLDHLLNSSKVLRYEAAKRLQFFQYKEIKNIVQNILLKSRYARHREIAAFILGQIQEKLDKDLLEEVIYTLINMVLNDKSINVKSAAISSLGHIFQYYSLGERKFSSIEDSLVELWDLNRYSIVISLTFSSAFFPTRDYIKKYLINNLYNNHPQIISWTLYSLKRKQYQSKLIEDILVTRLNDLPENSYIYSEVVAFLISINSQRVIPYLTNILRKNKIDDEIYTELKANSSKIFKNLKDIMLEKFN
ncbi:hypothetical protein [Neisseria zalophi]|uniref:HEAT repeat domain-containing protein n=1 Tax=Neisseria zalophi TaxID=640030 RepID=A0A5J6PU00_9NEIS|nr:hypothetical protein [Neisseria zalophi]QEY26198.1 hypothetical protein D0T92_06460 [Neisseria zalophi]